MAAGRSGARAIAMPCSSSLLTIEQRIVMLAFGAASAAGDGAERVPLAKMFTPDAACVRMLSELEPMDPVIAFGLCDLGLGFPEWGSVRLSETESIPRPLRPLHQYRFVQML